MNKKKDIKIRTLQSLIQKAMNNLEKEIKYKGNSEELTIAKKQLNDAMRILSMMHQGATCLNHPPTELQIIQRKPIKWYGYMYAYLGGEAITIDCVNA